MTRWFRYYDDALNDPKVQKLTGDYFKAWVNILCMASKAGGVIASATDVAFGLRLSEAKARAIVAYLMGVGLLDVPKNGYATPHNWDARQYKSDVSNERVKRHRERHRNDQSNTECNVTVTENETPPETEQNTEAETDQLSETESKNLNNSGKGKSWTPPPHGSIGKGRIYLEDGTDEWKSYAEDYRAAHGIEPVPNKDGGKWFKTTGESPLPVATHHGILQQ